MSRTTNFYRNINKVHDIKLILLGSTGVGKTSISRRLCDCDFFNDVKPTIGAEFFIKKIRHENNIFNLKIWDTAGQEKFKSLIPMYYRGAKIIFFVFDVTCEFSLDDLKTYVQDFINSHDYKNGSTSAKINPILFIIGNKSDLENSVNIEDVENYSKDIGAFFIKTSAKTNEGFNNLNYVLINSLLETYTGETQLHDDTQDDSVSLSQHIENNSCCSF